MKKIVALLIASAWLLAGCNTVHGFGKDVEHVGDKIQGK
ncbi:MAG TPA: entericidin A/B family lipoprotein [Oxalicibacterium sp.]|jgi:entericidin A|nr:entericidin A/B family lipoprotein [Oxalicibacterium sp.]